MKNVKRLLIILCMIIFCAGSFCLGIRYKEIKEQEINKNYVTQNLIAVVNTDEGTLVDDSKINYAAEFMNFPDVNFISTSLTDARDGVANGRYAAYVLIPHNFSEAIGSINRKPEKATIQYEIGNNLRVDVKEEVAQDIQEFITTLSTNVSYVYVNSIMEEFHSAQDGVKIVLNNDAIELEQINSINSLELISPFEYPEWERVEWELEDVDLNDYYSTLDETVVKIGNDYETYLEEGRLAFYEVDQKRGTLGNDVYELTKVIDSIDIEYAYAEPEVDENGNIICSTVSDNTVYAEGLDRLNNYESDSIAQLEMQKKELRKMITGSGNPSGNSLRHISDSVSSNCIAVKDAYEDVIEGEISVSWNSINGEKVTDQEEANRQYIVIEREALENLCQAVQGLDDIPVELDKTSDVLSETVDGMNIDIEDDVQNIIDNEIVKPLKSNIAAEAERLDSAENKIIEHIHVFMDELEEYDPLEYVDEEEINKSLAMIQENMGEMENTIEERNLEYIEFVTDIYDASDENYVEMLEEIDLVNEQTATNVDSVVETAKESRQEKNEINSALLSDFSKKLSYTRIGNQENKSVNEFIVSPLEIADVNTIYSTVGKNQQGKKLWLIPGAVFCGIAALLLISRFLYLYITKERKEGKA